MTITNFFMQYLCVNISIFIYLSVMFLTKKIHFEQFYFGLSLNTSINSTELSTPEQFLQ